MKKNLWAVRLERVRQRSGGRQPEEDELRRNEVAGAKDFTKGVCISIACDFCCTGSILGTIKGHTDALLSLAFKGRVRNNHYRVNSSLVRNYGRERRWRRTDLGMNGLKLSHGFSVAGSRVR